MNDKSLEQQLRELAERVHPAEPEAVTSIDYETLQKLVLVCYNKAAELAGRDTITSITEFDSEENRIHYETEFFETPLEKRLALARESIEAINQRLERPVDEADGRATVTDKATLRERQAAYQRHKDELEPKLRPYKHAQSLYERGEYKEAIRECDRIIAEKRGKRIFKEGIIRWSFPAEEYYDMLQIFQLKARSLIKRAHETHKNIWKKADEAIEILDKVLAKINQDNPEYNNWRTSILYDQAWALGTKGIVTGYMDGQNYVEGAVDKLKQAISLNPQYGRAYYSLARALRLLIPSGVGR